MSLIFKYAKPLNLLFLLFVIEMKIKKEEKDMFLYDTDLFFSLNGDINML